MRIGVWGAGGAAGAALVPELSRRGHQVRVVGRNEAALRAHFGGGDVEIVPADLERSDEALRAAESLDAIAYLVGVPYWQFDLHPKMMRIALDAARRAHVRRFFHLSNVYVYGKPQRTPVDETHPLEPETRKGRYRLEQERLALDANGDELRTTVLRPPDYYGPFPERSLVGGIFTGALDDKPAQVLGPIDTPHEFAFTPDLGPVIATMLEAENVWGEAFNFAGPATISVRKFGELVYAALGRRPRFTVANEAMLRLFGLFNPLMRELVEMQYLQSTPVLLDDGKLRARIGSVRKTEYAEGIRLTLEALRAKASVA